MLKLKQVFVRQPPNVTKLLFNNCYFEEYGELWEDYFEEG
jgi:hypothetical protein